MLRRRGWMVTLWLMVGLMVVLLTSQLGLAEVEGTSALLRSGSQGEPVRQLQAALGELGYAPGPADGVFGRQTELALRTYQRDRGITVDGIAGPATLALIRQDQASRPEVVDRGHMHVVRTGETLHSIATRYRLTWMDLMEYNRLSNPNQVFVGQALFIPGPDWEPGPVVPRQDPPAAPPVAVTPPRSPQGVVALTFNDSPHPDYTWRILEILQQHGVVATFFVIGTLAQTNPDLVRLMRERGHSIANHSYHHEHLRGRSPAYIEEEIQRTSQLVKEVTGEGTSLFRPPGGGYDHNVRLAVANVQHRLVMWTNISAQTPFNGSTQQLVQRVLDHVYDGCILMLHDGSLQTLEALPGIIEGIQARGLAFATL